MNSIEMINRLPPPSAGLHGRATPRTRATDFAPSSVGERLDELLPLIDVVAEAGPPVLFVLGPWLFVVLMLIGPFVLLVTLVLVAAIFVAVAGAACVLPYLLVHHLRRSWPRHPARHAFVRRHRPIRDLHPHPHTDVTSNRM